MTSVSVSTLFLEIKGTIKNMVYTLVVINESLSKIDHYLLEEIDREEKNKTQ